MEHANDPDSKYEAEVDLATDVDPPKPPSSPENTDLTTKGNEFNIRLQLAIIDKSDHPETLKKIARERVRNKRMSPLAWAILFNKALIEESRGSEGEY